MKRNVTMHKRMHCLREITVITYRWRAMTAPISKRVAKSTNHIGNSRYAPVLRSLLLIVVQTQFCQMQFCQRCMFVRCTVCQIHRFIFEARFVRHYFVSASVTIIAVIITVQLSVVQLALCPVRLLARLPAGFSLLVYQSVQPA